MFGKKIPVAKDLYERAAAAALERGYASLAEWVSDLLEEEMRRPRGGGSNVDKDEDDLKKRLQGLGYIS